MSQQPQDILPAVPPVAVSSMEILGVGLPDWVQIATLAYIGIMITTKIPDIIAAYKRARKEIKNEQSDS